MEVHSKRGRGSGMCEGKGSGMCMKEIVGSNLFKKRGDFLKVKNHS